MFQTSNFIQGFLFRALSSFCFAKDWIINKILFMFTLNHMLPHPGSLDLWMAFNNNLYLFQVEQGLKAYTDNGISLEEFEVVDQGEDCFYENPDGTSCDD